MQGEKKTSLTHENMPLSADTYHKTRSLHMPQTTRVELCVFAHTRIFYTPRHKQPLKHVDSKLVSNHGFLVVGMRNTQAKYASEPDESTLHPCTVHAVECTHTRVHPCVFWHLLTKIRGQKKKSFCSQASLTPSPRTTACAPHPTGSSLNPCIDLDKDGFRFSARCGR